MSLAPFSFRKGPNVYGIISGSGHPRGLEKFLSVAWQKDQLNGEADYDIEREDFREAEPFLNFDLFTRPKKTAVFESDLEKAICDRRVISKQDLYLFCLENGMLPKHAGPVLRKLKQLGVIECNFTSPRAESLRNPRPFHLRPA